MIITATLVVCMGCHTVIGVEGRTSGCTNPICSRASVKFVLVAVPIA